MSRINVWQTNAVCICFFFMILSPSDAIFEWLFGQNAESDSESDSVRVIRSTGLKFEVETSDAKFLQLKNAIEDLSDLDACNHIVSFPFNRG